MTRSVAVIGTGFSGICAAVKVERELGIVPVLFEMCKDVGGTWYQNRYPGAACDIPSHLYSLSFELKSDWPEHYSSQGEIYEYLRGVARKYGLYKKTKFETEVVSTVWIEDRQQWQLQWRSVNDHTHVETGYFDIVFAGLGPLRVPNVPKEFQGFEGPTVHTTFWDDSIDFTNKRVAVVGSGASAIQAIPELVKTVSHLYSYQRTPAWVSPRDQFRYPNLFKYAFRYVPFLLRFYRFLIYIQHEFYYVNFGYYNSAFGKRVRRAFEYLVSWRLKRAGRPDLIPLLMPDYPPGCKRIAKSENFLEALAKPNVTVERAGVAGIKGRTIVDKNGNENEVDILVLATGFDVQGFAGNLKIVGRNGSNLAEKWRYEFPKTYKSTAIPGFPNFFLLLGPSTGLGHNSVVTMIDIQVDFALKALKQMIRKDVAAIEPKQSATDEYAEKLQKSLKGTVWKGGCKSWYLNENGDVYGVWPGTIFSFWRELRQADLSKFIQYKKPVAVKL
ncbi:putative flavin-containing monooxygenase [Syncephalastrum racemosum]|uniref:Putative flavin-containing monooxygenase n=1 Tax=Syncephalastrum racemosum TaxID=13706 RepID=A0A1X2HM14_SYNRA|nr:putative flavin-containing monooxygenase [Syncephalastrum racemosum]